MHLKRLELSGFKSFAKTTVLEFPSKITAIVGPNGSGKSNVKEGIQWVLGEQSMKSLRGKKAEDLIWNGSPQVPRMGKASVTLIFDNKDGFDKLTTGGRIPLEFEEVSVGRKIFRDGLNEYSLNDSQVRLKDVIELMARIGLGPTRHNIIGQGEVDRVLLASLRERREVIEEALGLLVYQLKKNEAERKLELTENNMKQVEALVREIAPHLKFLRMQAKKAEARESVEEEVKQLQKIYLAKEELELAREKALVEERKRPFVERHKSVVTDIARLTAETAEAEKVFSRVGQEEGEDKELMGFEARQRAVERELGRLEGKLEVERERLVQPAMRAVDTRYLKDEIETFIHEFRSLLGEDDLIETLRAHLLVLVEDLEGLVRQIERGMVEGKRDERENKIAEEFERTIQSLQKESTDLFARIQKREAARVKAKEEYLQAQKKIRGLDSMLRVKQDEERDVALQLERIKFEEERNVVRENAFLEEVKKAGIERRALATAALDGYEEFSNEELKKKIERMRGKLEEIGGIDVAVVKEYQETEARHSFLTKELEDLKKASVSLRELVKELDQHIKEDFKAGFVKIKEEFHNYFRIIFGGGRATLKLIEVPIHGEEDLEVEEGVDPVRSQTPEASADAFLHRTSNGVEIEVDLPRKRIRGLAMLSGGERALTSVALRFAITAVNPPPFLVLDETDAALDEANSQRYAAILKELSKKTQLILVTHNRETMKCAGVLYGVTMGDDGVSKLLSLKLEEAEAYTNR